MRKNQITRWIARNALLLVSVILILLSVFFYLDVESRRAEFESNKKKNVSIDNMGIE
tara:strand:- start:843 stop:1013 length:171 start_codon:yes stop_codon:yes gene_type:complete